MVRRPAPWWQGHEEEWEKEGTRTKERDEHFLTAVDRFDRGVLLCPDESYQLVYSIVSLKGNKRPGEDRDGLGEGSENIGGAAESVAAEEGGFEEGVHRLGQVRLAGSAKK